MDLAERPEQVKTRQSIRIGKSHSFVQPNWQARFLRFAAIATVFGALSACQESLPLSTSGRAVRPIPSSTLTLMREKGTNSHAPVLIRTYKKEAELEIWKMKADGRYTLLKTFPMCRWSGQLGPKIKEGDRQVPEGFYTITPGQMNPNSNYYLSFNVGYPNAYDKAHGYTGGLIMVHGACSSAGCFSMTDEQIAEIYAIAREAFAGGQKGIQMQSLPFRMTPDNLALHRLDPNMPFWREIKKGLDAFEVTQQEPQVAFCGRRYVFNATPVNASARMDATAPCPALQEDEQLELEIAKKDQDDQAKVAQLVARGVQPIRLLYSDGGQHPDFQNVSLVSRPEALQAGPIEIPLDANGKPLSPLIKAVEAQQTTVVTSKPSLLPPAPKLEDTAKPDTTIVAASPAAAQAESKPFYSGFLTGLSSIGELVTPNALFGGSSAGVNQPNQVPLPPSRSEPVGKKPVADKGAAETSKLRSSL